MRLIRDRFSVIRLLIDVALVAGLVGFLVLWYRSVDYERLAVRHAEQEERFRHRSVTTREHITQYGSSMIQPWDSPDFLRRMGEYHGELADKYRRAARHPWLRLDPLPEKPVVP